MVVHLDAHHVLEIHYVLKVPPPTVSTSFAQSMLPYVHKVILGPSEYRETSIKIQRQSNARGQRLQETKSSQVSDQRQPKVLFQKAQLVKRELQNEAFLKTPFPMKSQVNSKMNQTLTFTCEWVVEITPYDFLCPPYIE